MKYKILSTKTGGRLGNQLYYVLQAFLRSNENLRWMYTNSEYTFAPQFNVCWCCEEMNISDFVCQSNKIDEYLPDNEYFQRFEGNVDEDSIRRFIKHTILKSSKFYKIHKTIGDTSKILSLHIRLGDYLLEQNKMFMCFDRVNFLKRAVQLYENISTIHVYSDDIVNAVKFVQENIDNKIEVIGITNTTPQDDLLKLSSYKNKILWNSTFSYWSGFISDCANENTKIVCPDIFFTNQPAIDRTFKNWIRI